MIGGRVKWHQWWCYQQNSRHRKYFRFIGQYFLLFPPTNKLQGNLKREMERNLLIKKYLLIICCVWTLLGCWFEQLREEVGEREGRQAGISAIFTHCLGIWWYERIIANFLKWDNGIIVMFIKKFLSLKVGNWWRYRWNKTDLWVGNCWS